MLSWLSDHLTDSLMVLLVFLQFLLLWKQYSLSKVLAAAAMDGSLKKVDRYLEAVEKRTIESVMPWLGCLVVLALLVGLGVWIGSFFK